MLTGLALLLLQFQTKSFGNTRARKHIDTETHRHTQTVTYGFIRNLRPISVTVPYVTKLYVQNKKRVQNMELA